MKTYKYTDATNQVVHIIDEDGLSRGSCLATNQEVVDWVAAGNTITPADPAPPVYIIVSPRQIRQALTTAGLRASVEAAVAAGDQDLKDWWEFATAFEENHPLIAAMATGLGVTSEQLHDLFVLAASK